MSKPPPWHPPRGIPPIAFNLLVDGPEYDTITRTKGLQISGEEAPIGAWPPAVAVSILERRMEFIARAISPSIHSGNVHGILTTLIMTQLYEFGSIN